MPSDRFNLGVIHATQVYDHGEWQIIMKLRWIKYKIVIIVIMIARTHCAVRALVTKHFNVVH